MLPMSAEQLDMLQTPEGRSRLLEPFPSGQRLRKKAWNGNILEPGEWISDWHLMVHRHMVTDPKLGDILRIPNNIRNGVSQDLARSLSHTEADVSQYPVEILGILPGVTIGKKVTVTYLLYYTDEEMFVSCVDMDLLNFFVRGVRWHTLTTGRTYHEFHAHNGAVVSGWWNDYHPIMFRWDGEPVGLLMPLRLPSTESQQQWDIDLPTAITHMRTDWNMPAGPSVYSQKGDHHHDEDDSRR